MNWLVLTLISPAFAAAVVHFDKYLLRRHMRGGGIGSLVIFSSLIGIPAAFVIYIFNINVFDIYISSRFLIMLTGTVYILWLLPYLYALEKDETSMVTPIFQTSSLFSFLLGYVFLGETLSIIEFLGGVLILMGSLALTLEFTKGSLFKIKYSVLFLMLLSSFLYSVNGLLFKVFALQESFWVTSFWQYIGISLTGILLLIFLKPYRKQFVDIVKQNSVLIIGLNATNEIINIVAKTAFDLATLLAPLALVYFVVEGFQPVFTLVYGIVLTIFFPRIVKENLEKRYLIQKIISIGTIFIGTILIHLF